MLTSDHAGSGVVSVSPLTLCQLVGKKYIVFSGGGAKGKAFNGALMALDAILKCNGVPEGIHSYQGFAGASIGACWAMLMAMNVTIDEMFEWSMSQDVAHVFQHINFMQFPKQWGVVSNKILAKQLEEMLVRKGFAAGITFKQLYNLTNKELQVCVTNVNLGIAEIWNYRTTPDYRVADAVATSMSIPGAFSPTQVLIEKALDASSNGSSNGSSDSIEKIKWKGIQIIDKPTISNAYVASIGPRYYVDGGLANNIPHHVFDPHQSLIFTFEEISAHCINSPKDYLMRLVFVPLELSFKAILDAVPETARCNIITLHAGQITLKDLNLEMSKSCALVQYAMYQMLAFWKSSTREYQHKIGSESEVERKWQSVYFALTVQLQLLIAKLTNTSVGASKRSSTTSGSGNDNVNVNNSGNSSINHTSVYGSKTVTRSGSPVNSPQSMSPLLTSFPHPTDFESSQVNDGSRTPEVQVGDLMELENLHFQKTPDSMRTDASSHATSPTDNDSAGVADQSVHADADLSSERDST